MRSALTLLFLVMSGIDAFAQDDVIVADLAGPDAGSAIESVRRAFRERNPGYDVAWLDRFEVVEAGEGTLVLFVQRASDAAKLTMDDTSTEVSAGDVVLLRHGDVARATGEIAALAFTVPEELDGHLPTVVRPDHDPRLTDTPGGCAEDADAYRRILLTWQRRNGPYNWRALNAHRVRIDDSFSHYHPMDGGFDEFYLVQAARPDARLISSVHTEAILDPDSVSRDLAADLLRSTELHTGSLVYVPRGVVHRGVGGVLAQVITVPGFRPGAEIGVDRHLAAINERLGLTGDAALPFHVKTIPDIDGHGVAIEVAEGFATVTIDDEPFTTLHTDGVPVPVLHPVFGPGGIRVTRAYPMASAPNESEDHPHHRGLWFAHGDVNGVDFWHDRAKRAGRIDVGSLHVSDPNVLAVTTTWRDERGNPMLAGERRLRFGRIGTARAIDLEVTLLAEHGTVRFGDTKEGTMAIRLAPELRLTGPVATGSILDSEGRGDAAVWGERARWVDYSGRIAGREIGVALLDHPSNPAHPCYWHARGYGLFAANPFGAHDFADLPRDSGALDIAAGERVRFRYRFVIHEGDAGLATIDEAWQRFAAP